MKTFNLFQYQVNIGAIRTNGVTRLHYDTYKNSFTRSVEFGVNIIPKKFGFCIWIDLVNRVKELEKDVEYWYKQFNDLKELIITVYGGWRK